MSELEGKYFAGRPAFCFCVGIKLPCVDRRNQDVNIAMKTRDTPRQEKCAAA